MFRINNIAKLAGLAVLVAVAAALAGAVQAATIDHDTVPTIGNDNFYFTGGDVVWHLSGRQVQRAPHGDAEAQQRRRIVCPDAPGVLPPRFVDRRQVRRLGLRTGRNEERVQRRPQPVLRRQHRLVKVSVEKQTAADGTDFSIVESAYFSPGTAPDKVMLRSNGVDFGGDEFSSPLNDPIYSADFYWNRGDGAEITRRLIGTYWLNNVAGLCARVDLTYETESGSFLAEKADGPFCAADNGVDHVGIDFQPYTSTQVAKVVVKLQSQSTNGSWNLVDSQTVTIDE